MSVRAKNARINGSILEERAMQFFGRLGKSNLILGNGWLQLCQNLLVILTDLVSGESAQVEI